MRKVVPISYSNMPQHFAFRKSGEIFARYATELRRLRFFTGAGGRNGASMVAVQAGWPVVLVVDDEAPMRAFVCEYLRECGFHTLGVESADVAIRLLELGLVTDLVFSDVRMPGERDGFGLARWMSENIPKVPVILTTGDLGKENAQSPLYQAEMMLKPYEIDSAVVKIRETIQSRRPVAN
jgi:CheY-like chemotaxis protein